MDDRSIQPGGAEHLPPPVAVPRHGPGSEPLEDPRALTILTTEHWSLLSARSLVYNEAFARAGMFLTFLSASLVALALVSQGMGFDRDFLLLAAIILGFDLFIGLATLGRVASASNEDLRCIAGMNRIRHAYLEIVPDLERYLITSQHDDLAGVLSTYGEPSGDSPSMFLGVLHGLTTTDGMISIITCAIGGILGSVLALLAGAAPSVAIGVGLGTFTALVVAMSAAGYRNFTRFAARLGPRFPSPPRTAPPSASPSDPGA
jgi:hypothetical protein